MKIPDRSPDFSKLIGSLESKELSAAMADPAYEGLVRQVEAKYLHWQKVKYRAEAAGLDPRLVWVLVKMSRFGGRRPLPLAGAPGHQMWFTMPGVVQEELMHIDQQLAGRVGASDEQPMSAAHQERFIVSSLREEAIASSMLEGAATTRRDAKKMLASGRKPRTRGERMVANNYQAISFVREHRRTPMTPEFLLEVQRILTEGTLERPDECGRFRRAEDGVEVTGPVGNVLHTPPPAGELAHRLRSLCDFANKKSGEGFIHPVVRASVIHFQLGFDHPFCDGNGRTARAVFYWSMLNAGYWLFEYLPISRLIYEGPSKYGRAYLYTETDGFDVTYFLVYTARILRRAREELAAYIARKQGEMAAAREVLRMDGNLNRRQREIVMMFTRDPLLVLSIQEHQSHQGVAYGTARSDMLGLVEMGYLEKVQAGNRFEFVRGARLIENEG